jgi:NTP pyrophosphatase (non-canonical NTP hydrolase)
MIDYDINDLTVRIYAWFDEKGLHDPAMQFAKLNEEVGEMAHELTRWRKDSEEMKDAIGDVFVTLVGMAHHLDMDLSECINMAYQTIRNRKGKVIEGSFVKEEKMKDGLSELPAFPSVELTMEQAKRLAQIAKEAREKYEKD